MKTWTKEELENCGYKIENAKITKVDLSMADHGCLCAEIVLEGYGWGCVYGGFKIGSGYLGAKEFKGYEHGTEYIMRIMDTVGVSKYNQMANKYIRVATLGWGDTIKIIGNIVEDKWFDAESFFDNKN